MRQLSCMRQQSRKCRHRSDKEPRHLEELFLERSNIKTRLGQLSARRNQKAQAIGSNW